MLGLKARSRSHLGIDHDGGYSYTVEPLLKGHSGDQDKCLLYKCPFNIGNIYKDFRNILQFRDQSLCPLNRGVPKEKLHCIRLLDH